MKYLLQPKWLRRCFSASLLVVGLFACALAPSDHETTTAPVIELQLSDVTIDTLYQDTDRAYRALLANTPSTCENAGANWSPIHVGDLQRTLQQLKGFGLRPQVNDCEQRAVYGAVLRWVQQHIVGISFRDVNSFNNNNSENDKNVALSLQPVPIGASGDQIKRVRAAMVLPAGIFKTQWQMNGPRMIVNVELPPRTAVLLTLPTSRRQDVRVGGQSLQDSGLVPLGATNASSSTTAFRLQGGASGVLLGFSFPLTPQT